MFRTIMAALQEVSIDAARASVFIRSVPYFFIERREKNDLSQWKMFSWLHKKVARKTIKYI